MKTIRVECTWKSDHVVEVPDDFTDTGHLSDFPEDVQEDFMPTAAELVDWRVRVSGRSHD